MKFTDRVVVFHHLVMEIDPSVKKKTPLRQRQASSISPYSLSPVGQEKAPSRVANEEMKMK
jgi:hypothetical protein